MSLAVLSAVAALMLSQVPLAQRPGDNAASICLQNPDAALDARLRLDETYSSYRPIATTRPTSTVRNADGPILAHSRKSLNDGLARYDRPVGLLITYIAADGSCSWLVSKDRVEAYARSDVGSARVNDLAAAFFGQMDVAGRSAARAPKARGNLAAAGVLTTHAVASRLTRFDGKALKALTEIIAPAPVQTAMQRFGSILIVPDEQLASFPYALLPANLRGSDEQPLIASASIQIVPLLVEVGIGRGLHLRGQPGGTDLTLGEMTIEQRRIALRSSLIVGDPSYEDRDYILDQLDGAFAEAENIAKAAGTSALRRERATLDAVKTHWSSRRPLYVHLATHGVADQWNARFNRSFLALANGGRLNATSLSQIRPRQGSIVVLSACQTGLGVVRPGGLVGLPRMLQRNGVQTVVMSLWNVDDKVTAYMMTRFFHHLVETGRAPEAHALAVRETRKLYPDPALWASFLVFGVGQF